MFQATKQVINNRSKHIRPNLYENIVVSGEDISLDLEASLKQHVVSVPQRAKISVSAIKDCKLAPWIGLSVLSSLEDRKNPVLEACSVLLV